MKRLLVILAVLLIVSLTAACSQGTSNAGTQQSADPNSSAQTQQPQSNDAASEDQPAEEPTNNREGVTLNIALMTTSVNDDYADNEFTRWLTEETGVNFTFNVLTGSTAEAKQKLNLMLSSGDYPGIITGGGGAGLLNFAEQQIYADQGVLLPLNDLIDQYGVNFKQALTKFPNYDIVKMFPCWTAICTHCPIWWNAITAA